MYTDNEMLKFLHQQCGHRYGVPNTVPEFNNAIYTDWTVTSQRQGEKYLSNLKTAANKCYELGMDDEAAYEVLTHNGYEAQDVKTLIAMRTQQNKQRPVLASKYEDIAHNIEALATDLSPDDFLATITSNNMTRLSSREEINVYDIVRRLKHCVSNPELTSKNSTVRIAHNMRSLMSDLHTIIKPFVEEELEISQLSAMVKSASTTIISTGRDNIYSTFDGQEACKVDLQNKTCNCDRFRNGVFAKIGIPCEHIVLAHRKYSDEGKQETFQQSIEEIVAQARRMA